MTAASHIIVVQYRAPRPTKTVGNCGRPGVVECCDGWGRGRAARGAQWRMCFVVLDAGDWLRFAPAAQRLAALPAGAACRSEAAALVIAAQ